MLIGLLYLAAAALALAMGRYLHREIREKRLWPTVPGKLVERGLGPKMQTQGPGMYLPHVKYHYVINQTEYVGDQCYLVRGTGGLDRQILKLVSSLPESVPVHYNPADPGQSYLLVNPRSTYWLLMGMGLLATLVGLVKLLTASVQPF